MKSITKLLALAALISPAAAFAASPSGLVEACCSLAACCGLPCC